MPLKFESISHGTIAFGFFNVKSDLLLLENIFIFADEFCHNVVSMPEITAENCAETTWRVWRISRGPDMGDLMGAMHGISDTGFFGELYKKYPFPELWRDFKQNPEGWKTRQEVEKIIEKYGELKSIQFRVKADADEVHIGEYSFKNNVFEELINYVWEGGYPKWKNGQRPEYVLNMMDWIKKSRLGIFSKLVNV